MASAGGPGALGAGTAEPWAEAIWPARAGDRPATARLPAVDWCLTGGRPDFATMSTPALARRAIAIARSVTARTRPIVARGTIALPGMRSDQERVLLLA